MCLTIDKKFSTFEKAKAYFEKPLIVEKEFPVYKILESVNKTKTSGVSPFTYFPYEKGYQYSNDVFSAYYKNANYKMISILNNEKHNRWFVNGLPINSLNIEEGLHAYINKNSNEIKSHLNQFEGEVIEIWVPKGAKYFLGKDDDIVTNELIWY